MCDLATVGNHGAGVAALPRGGMPERPWEIMVTEPLRPPVEQGVDASIRITSLELQNKQLDDELEKVKGEHTSLNRSSVVLHDSLTKAAEERDQIQEC